MNKHHKVHDFAILKFARCASAIVGHSATIEPSFIYEHSPLPPWSHKSSFIIISDCKASGKTVHNGRGHYASSRSTCLAFFPAKRPFNGPRICSAAVALCVNKVCVCFSLLYRLFLSGGFYFGGNSILFSRFAGNASAQGRSNDDCVRIVCVMFVNAVPIFGVFRFNLVLNMARFCYKDKY